VDDPTLDIEQHDQLIRYLRATDRLARDETPRLQTLAGGVSNRTVLVERPTGESWVIKQALAKLRVKVDWFSDPARVHREALGLRWLEKLAPPGAITPLVFEDEHHHLLAMRAVPQPHENWKSMLLAGRVDTEHVRQFAAILATIHGNAADARDTLAAVFDDRSFFETLRLEPYYGYTASQVPQAREFLHRLIDDTRGRRRTLVHGDYSPKNILVRDGRLVLLDHEVIHWGDGAFDVGFALTHFLSKMNHLPAFRLPLLRAALRFFSDYAMRAMPGGNVEEERMMVRHTLGCMLARVDGRSPLEYLSESDRDRQRRAVIEMMQSPPRQVAEVISTFHYLCETGDADN
jgi:aminoglycoside phosphotransferase (APT) family kinase protein